MFGMFWDSQGVSLAHFQKRCGNVNSALYWEVLLKLLAAIHRKCPGQLKRGVLLHHDNARLHIARRTHERIQELQWELPEHLPYNPDLALSNFHLFGPLKNHRGSKRFADDNKVETKVWKWLRQQLKHFYAAGFDTLVKQWDKHINVGGYVEE
jgi:hypothetical protein